MIRSKEMFLSVWRQLAPRYKEMPYKVIFEILNEPDQKLTVDMWNTFLAEAVKIIRETNPYRTLIIGPGNWNGIIESLGLFHPWKKIARPAKQEQRPVGPPEPVECQVSGFCCRDWG